MIRRVIPLLIASILLAAGSAGALTCMPPPRTEEEARERIKLAEMVILGRVEEISCRLWMDRGEIRGENYVRLMVVEGFKGARAGTEVKLQIDRCSYTSEYFEIQDTYLIFAHSLGLDGRPHTDECNFFKYEKAHELAPGENARLKELTAVTLKALREPQ